MGAASYERARTVDCGALYRALRRELVGLLREADDDALERPVPASPAWRVRDVAAHVVGIAADLNAQRFPDPGDDGTGWTAAQVVSRSAASIDELAAEWEREGPAFEDGLRLFGYETGSHYVGDLHVHAEDVRDALGLPRGGDETLLRVALDFYLGSFAESLRAAGLGLDLDAGGERHRLGDGPPVAELSAGPYELLRAMAGRRSERQIRAMAWRGDIDAVVPLVSRYGLPDRDLPR